MCAPPFSYSAIPIARFSPAQAASRAPSRCARRAAGDRDLHPIVPCVTRSTSTARPRDCRPCLASCKRYPPLSRDARNPAGRVPLVDLGYPLASDCVLGRMLRFTCPRSSHTVRASTPPASRQSQRASLLDAVHARRVRRFRPIRLPYAQLLLAITSTSDPPTTPSSPANRSVASSCLRYSACKSLPPP